MAGNTVYFCPTDRLHNPHTDTHTQKQGSQTVEGHIPVQSSIVSNPDGPEHKLQQQQQLNNWLQSIDPSIDARWWADAYLPRDYLHTTFGECRRRVLDFAKTKVNDISMRQRNRFARRNDDISNHFKRLLRAFADWAQQEVSFRCVKDKKHRRTLGGLSFRCFVYKK